MPTEDALVERVATRYLQALAYDPDPMSYKAFMSEFRTGVQTGAEEAAIATSGADQVGYHGRVAEVDDLVTSATDELLELAKRLANAARQGRATIGINEHRLVPKMSGILSTLFYNLGKLRGLHHGTGDA